MDKPFVAPFIYSLSLQNMPLANGLMQSAPVNIINMIEPKYIPTHYSFAITFIINNFDKIKNEVGCEFIDPNGKRLVKFPPMFIKDMGMNLKESLPSSHTVGVDLRNFILDMEGTYKTKVIIDGDNVKEFPIEVRRVKNVTI